MKFAEIIKQLREQAGYTQRDLADVLHITKTSISHYELGISMPNIDTLLQIADLFDVSLDYLMGRLSIRIPHNILQQQYVKGIDNATILNRLNTMDMKHRQLLLDVLKCIESDNAINNINKRSVK